MSQKIALVTGASRGIGKAVCLALADEGYDIVATARTLKSGDRHDHMQLDSDGAALPGSLEETAEAIRERGREVLLQRMDLLDPPSSDALVEAAMARFGRIDALVNNGIYQGKGLMADFLTGDLDDIRDAFEANVIAQVHLTRLVLPHMFARGGGVVVNMTSAAGMMDPPVTLERGGWGFGHGATKAALHRMAGMLQLEYASRGLLAFNLEPGMVLSESFVASMEGTDILELGIPTAPVEVPAAVTAWLCTAPEAREFAGQNIHAQPFCAKRGLLPGWPPPKGS